MDPNIQQPAAPQSPPVIETPESPPKSHVLPIALAGLTLLVLGVSGGYLVANSNKRPVTQNTNQVAQVSPTSTSVPPSPTPTTSAMVKITDIVPTSTPDIFVNWKNYSDTKYHFSFKYPTDWTTQMKDYSENNQRLINIIKNTSPSVVSLSFTIKNDWSNTGNAESQPKNYSVGGVPAYRLDPPKKEERQLERYQTNVYFENQGSVYIFMCTHNWDQNYINTCNNILSTFKFTN
ncbi:hypothetical protein BH11PAT1_BH11PAT1_0700 [soil metagenome]